MAKRTAKDLTDLVPNSIRPALAGAQLITGKQASDLVYATTLAEELRGIEKKLAMLESELHLAPDGESQTIPGERPSAKWIRSKSAELEVRLRRLERSCEQEIPQRMHTTGSPSTRTTTDPCLDRLAQSDSQPMVR